MPIIAMPAAAIVGHSGRARFSGIGAKQALIALSSSQTYVDRPALSTEAVVGGRSHCRATKRDRPCLFVPVALRLGGSLALPGPSTLFRIAASTALRAETFSTKIFIFAQVGRGSLLERNARLATLPAPCVDRDSAGGSRGRVDLFGCSLASQAGASRGVKDDGRGERNYSRIRSRRCNGHCSWWPLWH